MVSPNAAIQHFPKLAPKMVLARVIECGMHVWSLACAGDMEFEVALSQPSASYILEHRVMGRPLLPGTAMLDSCLAAASVLLKGKECHLYMT